MAEARAETLSCEGLTTRYGEARVLDGVTLALEPGRATALIGPNGAGKSTLLLTLAGLRRASSGEVRLGGRGVAGMGAPERARRMGVVLQAAPAAFGFTALEVVLMGVEQSRSRFALPGKREVARATEALEAFECGGLARRPVTTLSGGELQRVMLARALATRAGWWMLDEPTAALDPRHALVAMRLMRGHCAEGGGALAVVHDPNLVEGFFDEVVALREGRLVAHGPVADVLDEELLSGLYDAPLRATRDGGRRVWSLDPGD